MTFKGQGANFLITEIDKNDRLTYEGHKDHHPGSPSSKRLMKSHTLNRLVHRSFAIHPVNPEYRKVADSRNIRYTNPMEISGYFQVREGTGLSYRRPTKLCVCGIFRLNGTRK